MPASDAEHLDSMASDAMMSRVRTTVTLDPDVAAKLQRVTRERGVSFKKAINDAVRAGLADRASPSGDFRVHARSLGIRPEVNVDKALALASEMEDAEILRKLELRK
jgi:hypothetical protein